MDKVKIPDNLIGKFSVESCSYYPAGDTGSVMAQCGTVEIDSRGWATLEGFVLPQDSSPSISPFFIGEALSKHRNVINNCWGGSWKVESIHPGWPETPSIYLERHPETISLHGLKKIPQD